MDLQNKKVSVFGVGKSGISALKLLKKCGAEVFAINTNDPKKWSNYQEVVEIVGSPHHCIRESASGATFGSSELIIISPGIPVTHPVLQEAINKDVPIWSELELGFLFATVPIVAVTGTNGKTTTVTILGEMIKNAGKKVFVGGNIGIPLCEYALTKQKYDYIVLEVSSFQLETIHTFKPKVAIVLNIMQNHGERYTHIDDYASAKFNIVSNMGHADWLIYPQDDERIRKWGDTVKNCSQLRFDSSNIEEVTSSLKNKFDLTKFKLLGDHNLVNLNFAVQAIKKLELDNADISIQKTIDTFSGVDYRLQFVPCDYSFTAYNDAKSTNWDATLTAIKSIKKGDKKLYLIIGGQKRGRGDSITPYLDLIKHSVDKVLLIGEMTDPCISELKDQINCLACYTLKEAMKFVIAEDFKGILLFSPAFPSFDQFSDYIDRGQVFTSFCQNKQIPK